MVKALDLSSNGGIPAWVRTPLLVNFFLSALSLWWAKRLDLLFSKREKTKTREKKVTIFLESRLYLIEIEKNDDTEVMTQITDNG